MLFKSLEGEKVGTTVIILNNNSTSPLFLFVAHRGLFTLQNPCCFTVVVGLSYMSALYIIYIYIVSLRDRES